ncbi:MAG: hypothetical protein ACP5N3_05835 [Candidatus Nanoarchaeia archaeon]
MSKEKINKQYEIPVGKISSIKGTYISVLYSGMLNNKTFDLTAMAGSGFHVDGFSYTPTIHYPLEKAANQKEIRLLKDRFNVLEATPDKIMLQYLGEATEDYSFEDFSAKIITNILEGNKSANPITIKTGTELKIKSRFLGNSAHLLYAGMPDPDGQIFDLIPYGMHKIHEVSSPVIHYSKDQKTIDVLDFQFKVLKVTPDEITLQRIVDKT